ncbi:FkbM family methyltransferase [Cyanobium sp. ATX 6A2]|uniref:FkbM family methyltransferase n=1 Tax=Cyanobium sp. ATX 6A2 TaxID=2823700 RepID=UPI0020CE76DD|nr:FkbM family methyltransferase [Cyanobium sp. ATX 6A2]MCP9886999.1 FkbM family methyltransferase [Cyanobium sp. ATX 6A2]
MLDVYASVFGKPWLAKFNKALVLAGLRGQGILNYQDFRISGEKGFARSVLKTYKERRPADLPPTDAVVFDVGANVGNWALMVTSLKIETPYRLFAFEPSPETFTTLAARVREIPAIKTFNIGLSNQRGAARMHDYADSSYGSTHASLEAGVITEVHGQQEKTFKVEVTTGDEFCRQQRIRFIDLLKVDVEGHELKVLQGFREMIASRKIGAIQFEFNETMIPSRTFLNDFRFILGDYSLFRILPKGRLLAVHDGDLPVFRYQNIAAILGSDHSQGQEEV